jgi:hypothetical protein
MKKRIAVFFGVTSLALGTAGTAAAQPFLCPIVGDGVLNADAHNGDNGVAAIMPPAGTSLLPGNNQAGAQANPNAYNAFGGPEAGNTPGTAGFTPIWNP